METNSCIGFDADFTLITYDLKRFAELQYRSLSNCMIKLGLPEDLLAEEFTQGIECHIETGLIADFHTGCVIKLGHSSQVLKALYGFEELSAEELRQVYPTSQYSLKNEYTDYVENSRYLFLSHFSYGGLHLFQVAVELRKRGRTQLSFADIGRNIREAVVMNYYGHSCASEFYQEFYTHPEKYVRPASEELKTSLQQLKEHHIVVLVSNSTSDYIQFVFEFSFGSNWKSYFDYIVYNAHKPGFFMCRTPFQQLSPQELRKGNSVALQEIVGCREYWYVGDHYIGDVEASKKAGWRSCCVLNELVSEFGCSSVLSNWEVPEGGIGLPELAYTEKWGSHFTVAGVHTFWWAFLREHADLVGGTIDGVTQELLSLSKSN